MSIPNQHSVMLNHAELSRSTKGLALTSIFIFILVIPVIIISFVTTPFIDLSWCNDRAECLDKWGQVVGQINPPFNSALDPTFFSPEDVMHMGDVRNVFIAIYIVLTVATLLVLSSTRFLTTTTPLPTGQAGPTSLVTISIWFLVLMVIVVLFAVLDWQTFFNLLHQVVFPYNTFWQLDPATSNLIKYLPSEVFQKLTVIYFVLVVVILGVINLIAKKYEHNNTHTR